eukprot:3397616-Rhodomonas_salina.1
MATQRIRVSPRVSRTHRAPPPRISRVQRRRLDASRAYGGRKESEKACGGRMTSERRVDGEWANGWRVDGEWLANGRRMGASAHGVEGGGAEGDAHPQPLHHLHVTAR